MTPKYRAAYLVTGGAGFIGANCVGYLLNKDCRVRVIDDLSTGKIENIKEYLPYIEFIEADVADKKAVNAATEDMDYILHLAAIPSVQYSIEDPEKANQSMVTATVALLKAAAARKKIKRVVQATSAAAYGDGAELPKKEDMLPAPRSPYAAAKLSQEFYAYAFANAYGLKVHSLRFFNVYGPKQDPSSPYSGVISIFINKIISGESPIIYGDGKNTRDFVHVNDAVRALELACSSPWHGQSEIINIGTGSETSLNQLLDTLNSIAPKRVEAVYQAARSGDVRYSYADISKARSLIGYEPKISIEEGLGNLFEYVAK